MRKFAAESGIFGVARGVWKIVAARLPDCEAIGPRARSAQRTSAVECCIRRHAINEGRKTGLAAKALERGGRRRGQRDELDCDACLGVAAPGEILLLFFGYTSCPDVCPTTLADYRAAFDSMPRELVDRISFGMIGIDRERDADGEIDAYVSLFMENGHALLAPDEPALAAAAETFGVRYEIEDHESGAIDYLVGHTATVFAIDEDGHIIWEIGYPTPPDDITATLTDLLGERY